MTTTSHRCLRTQAINIRKFGHWKGLSDADSGNFREWYCDSVIQLTSVRGSNPYTTRYHTRLPSFNAEKKELISRRSKSSSYPHSSREYCRKLIAISMSDPLISPPLGKIGVIGLGVTGAVGCVFFEEGVESGETPYFVIYMLVYSRFVGALSFDCRSFGFLWWLCHIGVICWELYFQYERTLRYLLACLATGLVESLIIYCLPNLKVTLWRAPACIDLAIFFALIAVPCWRRPEAQNYRIIAPQELHNLFESHRQCRDEFQEPRPEQSGGAVTLTSPAHAPPSEPSENSLHQTSQAGQHACEETTRNSGSSEPPSSPPHPRHFQNPAYPTTVPARKPRATGPPPPRAEQTRGGRTLTHAPGPPQGSEYDYFVGARPTISGSRQQNVPSSGHRSTFS
ncbi:hypothetical protein K440DRAFT_638804 [Wilcoxina mikolae CBS 423.85]|nr:hypothetical protein K440DRAFT_638804 [Wilcoxina mikolae CBS 423.85]